jgi:hypothetical protein
MHQTHNPSISWAAHYLIRTEIALFYSYLKTS